MRASDIIQETYGALTVNKARSGLTILGIVIGIGSVIALVSLGQGAQDSIASNIQALGSNLLMVRPGAQTGPGAQVSAGRGSASTLTIDDAEAIKKELPLAKAVAPETSSRLQVTARGTNTNTTIVGTTPDYLTARNVKIDQGSFVSDQHLRSLSKVAVLGPTTRDDLFGEGANAIGQKVRINRVEFTVIGITAVKGGSGFANPDDAVYVPLTTAQRFLTGGTKVGGISVEAADQASMDPLKEQITDLLLRRHNIPNAELADFSILSQADIIATISQVTQALTSLLAAVAAISLVVGGIGIMNMMLTTVTERTREIGLRKAIGAKNRDIRTQFLIEAVALTFLGGAIGIVLGAAVSVAIGSVAGYASRVSVSSIMLSVGVSGAIGIVFGYYPALRASRLNPIEALRYE
ncbi:ABC transporter permease [Candidatus Uhrbacteria bacterium]|nr:ABC transporter permease [Candidatus Uhrbacteria bacterium]